MPEVNSIFIECYVVRSSKDGLKFLLLKRSDDDSLYPGIWQIVTGRIEAGEKAYETALREVGEETGLTPEKLFVLPHTTGLYLPEKDSVSIIPLFVCLTRDTEVKISREHSSFLWLDARKAAQKLFFKSQKENVNFIGKGFGRKSLAGTFIEIKI